MKKTLFSLFNFILIVLFLINISFAIDQNIQITNSKLNDKLNDKFNDYYNYYSNLVLQLIYNIPEVKKADAELYQAYYDLKLAYGQYGINLDSYYNYGYNQPTVKINIGLDTINISNDYPYNYGLKLTKLLYSFNFVENIIISKKINYYSKYLKKKQVLNDNYLKFYELMSNVVKAKDFLDYTENLINYTNEFLKTTYSLYSVGILPKLDYIKSQATYQDSLTQNIIAKDNYKLAKQSLLYFLNTTEDNFNVDSFINYIYKNNYQQKIYLKNDTLNIDLSYLNELNKDSKDLLVSKILYSSIESLRYQGKSLDYQNYPKLLLAANYDKHRPTGFSKDYTFNINLSLSWKIFDSNNSYYNKQILLENVNSLYQDYKRLIINLDLAKNNYKTKFINNYNSLISLYKTFDYQKEVFRINKLRYQNGLSTYLEYLDAQNSLLQSELNLNNIKSDLLLNYVYILYYNDIDLNLNNFLNYFIKIIK
ncbi:MAG: TolC family protein [bacterium]